MAWDSTAAISSLVQLLWWRPEQHTGELSAPEHPENIIVSTIDTRKRELPSRQLCPVISIASNHRPKRPVPLAHCQKQGARQTPIGALKADVFDIA